MSRMGVLVAVLGVLVTVPARAASAPCPGPLMFIGGGKDQDDLMRAFIRLAGGPARPIVVVPLASDDPPGSGRAYVTYLHGLGAHQVGVMIPRGAPSTTDLDTLGHAGGLFFSGGDQTRVLSTLRAPWVQALAAASYRGAVIAGTSAGAMVWGDRAITDGDPLETALHGMDPSFDGLRMQRGLGIAPDFVVDTHFSQRGRFPRLADAVSQAPDLVGLGVDPMTAAIVKDGTLQVAGRGTVTVVRSPDATPAASGPLHLRGLKVDVLSAGDRLPLSRSTAPVR